MKAVNFPPRALLSTSSRSRAERLSFNFFLSCCCTSLRRLPGSPARAELSVTAALRISSSLPSVNRNIAPVNCSSNGCPLVRIARLRRSTSARGHKSKGGITQEHGARDLAIHRLDEAKCPVPEGEHASFTLQREVFYVHHLLADFDVAQFKIRSFIVGQCARSTWSRSRWSGFKFLPGRHPAQGQDD